MTIDLFFRTLAQAYGQRVVCVIMSGTDSDGVIGLKHIRAQGGLTIVQDPNEAEHDSMPATAITTGMVDWVLPVEKMASKLLEFVRNENRMKLPPEIPEADKAGAKVADAPGGETVSDETRDPEDESAIAEVLADGRKPAMISPITNAPRSCAESRDGCRSIRWKVFRNISSSSALIRSRHAHYFRTFSSA